MSAGTLYIAIKGDTKDLVTALKSAQNASISYGKGAKQAITPVQSAIEGLKRNVVALGATWLGAQGLKAVVSIADQYALLDSKIKLVSGSSGEFKSTYAELFRISQETGSSFSNNASNYANLALALKDTNYTSKETLALFDSVNKSLVVAGATTAEASSFMLQFRQAMGSGKLAGDEFRGMMESNSYWGGQLAKALGTDVAGLREMAKDGKLTTDVLMRAFPAMSAQIEKDFSGIEKTISRAMVELSNAFNDVVADANKTTGGTASVAEAVSDLATTITDNKEVISSLFVGIIKSAKLATETVVNFANSMRVLRLAMHSDQVSMFDWIGGSPEDMKRILGEFGDGVSQTKALLAQVRDEIKETQDQWGLWSDKKGKLEELRKEEAELIAWLEKREKVAVDVAEAVKKTEEDIRAASKKTNTEIEKGADKVSKKKQEAAEKAAKKEIEALEKVRKAEEKAAKEREEETLNKILAMNGIANAQSATTDTFVRLEQLKADAAEDATDSIKDDYEDAADSITSRFGNELGDFFTESFDNIGEAWDNLWKGMLGATINYLGDIVSRFAASKLADLASKMFFSHDGTWDLKDDEYNAVLQKGEMVIPKDQASEIRDNFKNGDFDGLAASSAIGVDGFRSLDNAAISSGLRTAFDIGATVALGGTANIGKTVAKFGTGVMRDLISDALGIDDNKVSSFGSTVGGFLGAFLGPMGALIGSLMGGYLGSELAELGITTDYDRTGGDFGGDGGFGGDIGNNADGGGSMGRGGFGDDGDMGMDNEGYAHTGGYLLKADEGRIIAQTGEGILSRTGMRNLDKLNTGSLNGDDSEIKPILLAIAVSVRESAKALRRAIDDGIPIATRTAVNTGFVYAAGIPVVGGVPALKEDGSAWLKEDGSVFYKE